MCIKSYIYFTKCDHVLTSLTPCPTHHKEQESAKGFFGCLFWRSSRKKKNCGKVVPHHLQSETYCQACAVRKDHFRAQGVGHGALKVRKQGFQETFHEENKGAARLALQRAEEHRRLEGKSNHEVVHTETSVWLTDLYHHPETLAQKETYARQAARAPPVSSRHRTESHPKVIDLSPETRIQEHPAGGSRRAEWMPAYGYSQPMIRPAQPAPTHQYPSRYANDAPSLSPAVGHSPHMPRDYRSFAARTQATGRPNLQSEASHLCNPARGRNEQPVSPRQAYMNEEVKSTPREIVHYGLRPYWERNPSRREARKAAMSSWIEKNKKRERDSISVDDDSDVSFVCRTSKAISNQQLARGARRSHRRSAGSGRSGNRH
ncbi:hypothetical protein F4782DRAFT_430694 [Xylaria castorea]|nr:hypothetical protein F4782DRAFT_430694 [Xylaria castorea]